MCKIVRTSMKVRLLGNINYEDNFHWVFQSCLSLCAGFIFPSYANYEEERDSTFENQTSELTLPNSHYYLGWSLIFNFWMIRLNQVVKKHLPIFEFAF